MKLPIRYALALCALACFTLLTGCMIEHHVTTRPEYAYPQNLLPLCGQDRALTLVNKGVFEASRRYTGTGDALLLSSLLLPDGPERQRHYTRVQLAAGVDGTLVVTGLTDAGIGSRVEVPPESLTCGAEGELVMALPATLQYVWATVAKRASELALWTNSDNGLVVQHRWKETFGGIVGGAESGDAWATFVAAASGPEDSAPLPNAASLPPAEASPPTAAECAPLADNYRPIARVVHRDGTLDTRSALDQFFRVELIGEQPVNMQQRPASRFAVVEEAGGALTLSLYDGEELLGSRQLPADDISCVEGRWRLHGKREIASPWLLLLGSGGVSWEDLTLWRDANGDLLVEGVHKARNAIFLIPIVDTQTLFMAFPKE